MPPNPTSWKSILISYFHSRLSFPFGLFPSDFPTKTSTYLYCLSYVPHGLPISLFWIWSSE
jgi:hypothetical protein